MATPPPARTPPIPPPWEAGVAAGVSIDPVGRVVRAVVDGADGVGAADQNRQILGALCGIDEGIPVRLNLIGKDVAELVREVGDVALHVGIARGLHAVREKAEDCEH